VWVVYRQHSVITISIFFYLSITEETWVVEMRIWCIKIVNLLVLHYNDVICQHEFYIVKYMQSDVFHTNCLTVFDSLNVALSWSWNRNHVGCDRSTADVYSSWALDFTTSIFRCPHNKSNSRICILYRIKDVDDFQFMCWSKFWIILH
jgi:hypothetical protein